MAGKKRNLEAEIDDLKNRIEEIEKQRLQWHFHYYPPVQVPAQPVPPFVVGDPPYPSGPTSVPYRVTWGLGTSGRYV